jgi:hypothetical protein
MFEVVAGNIGTVCTTGNMEVAQATFAEYVKASKRNLSARVHGEPVTLLSDGEISREYAGTASA